ncbi:SMI1/KNR4 family protein [Trinickia fusca]|nr:SMI1/KNR4 family protein [Trinickia fusca]
MTVPGAMQSEVVQIEDALMRVTAADVVALRDVPSVPLAACEGYALRASDTANASRREPVELSVDTMQLKLRSRAGSPAARAIEALWAAEIPAYTPLPENADALAPKHVHRRSYKEYSPYLRLHSPLLPGHHVIAQGSEYRKGEMLLAKGERITAQRQAALIAAGVCEVSVTKRPRIGVLIAGYDQVLPGDRHESWRRPDVSGPYIRAMLRRWGYDVPPVEYLIPADMAQPPLDVQRDERAFRRELAAFAQRYDLIVGAGMPVEQPFQNLGLNAQVMYSNGRALVEIKQTPAGRFNFGRSENRSLPKHTVLPLTRPDGTQGGSQTLTSYDQATLINLPGYTSAVAVLMHTIVSRVLDLLEHVASPGPYWETGKLAHDVAHDVVRDAARNGMRWGNLSWGPHGEPLVHLLPFQGDEQIRGVAQAGILAAIPAGDGALPAGSTVQFLRLDRAGFQSRQVEAMHVAVSTGLHPQPEPLPEAPNFDSAAASTNLRDTWKQLDDWFAADPARLPGGLNGPANADEIATLHALLDVTLPNEFVESLGIHNGQANPGAVFADDDTLLNAREIVAQWSIWRKLVADGDFDDTTSEPDPGVKDDWYNLKWIPFTHDGSGNHLCLDLDPAEGGVVGQVIRVWHDDVQRERVAWSFAQWLAQVAAERAVR